MTISAKIIAYSRDHRGRYIVSWELEYPRFIHGEFMTHRLFSRNAASSRAIPVATMIDLVQNDPAMPIHWGQNQPGMQAKAELGTFRKKAAIKMWKLAAKAACKLATAMNKIGLHKQVGNRILEPFQNIKVVMTATCMDNFFWLRNHEDAQPEIKELARLMWEALQGEEAALLNSGDWHVPYFGEGYWLQGCGIPLADALAISASCCAQVSYRKADDSLEKAQMVFKRLVESKPVHASPFEHQATPMKETVSEGGARFSPPDRNTMSPDTWEKGITHMDRNYNLWSGNFIGFIQHRQLLDDHTCWEYKG